MNREKSGKNRNPSDTLRDQLVSKNYCEVYQIDCVKADVFNACPKFLAVEKFSIGSKSSSV